jgi:hypothetical protein
MPVAVIHDYFAERTEFRALLTTVTDYHQSTVIGREI